jgi:hypothetical protein
MSELAVAAALAVTIATGWSALAGVTARLSRPERFAWALSGGLLIQGLVLVAATALSLRPTRAVFLAADLAIVGAGFLLRRGRRTAAEPEAPGGGPGRSDLAAKLLLTLALLAWLVFLVEAVSEPMWSTDFLAIWGMKGKVVYLTGSVPARLFRDPALYWAHREYPLLVPFSLASLASLAGEWNDRALALLFPGCALATWLAVYGFLARRSSAVGGAIGAVLTTFCFCLYHPVNAGTAETVFALGAVLAASAFLDLAHENDSATRWRLAIAALFCAATKQEGTLWVFLLGAVWLVFLRRSPRTWTADDRRTLAAFAVPPALHWIALFLLRGNATRRDFDFARFEPAHWRELGANFAHVVSRIATTEAREAAIGLAAIAVYLLVTRPGFADALFFALGAQILFYCVAFSVSSFDPMYAVDGAFRRIALTLFPVAALALAARWPGSAPAGASPWSQSSSSSVPGSLPNAPDDIKSSTSPARA